MKKIAILFIVIIGGINVNYSQNTIDIITISGHFGTPKKYTESYDDRAQETGVMLGLVAPIKISKNTYWYNSLNYFYWSVNNDIEMPNEIVNPMQLHGFILRSGIYHKFNKNKGIQLLFSPRLMSDLENISGSHYQFGGVAMYEVTYHSDLSLSYGVMYNQELFGPYVIPVLKMNWQLNNRWQISGLLPVYSKISYQATPNLHVGINHFGLVSTFKLGDLAYHGDYVERRSIDMGLFGKLNLGNNLYLEGRIGYSLDRRYEQYGESDKIDLALPVINFGDNRIQKNVSFKDSPYANLRLIYSLKLPE